MQPVLYDLTSAFTRQHPTILFELTGSTSTTAEEQVMAAQIDLAASTLISSTVADGGGQNTRQSTAIRIPIGLDGLALIVHPDNPVAKLSLAQLQALYSGRTLAWAEVGGPPLEVLLISREEGSGNRQLFETRVMGEERVSLTAVVMPTNRDVIDYVAAHPNAIGYVSRAYVTVAVEQASQSPPAANAVQPIDAPGVKVVVLADQLPTQQAIQSQNYPLIQPLYLVSRVRPSGALQQFIDFALSPAGQAIVARYHGRVR
jgi:phosphate transport system substrate-binding protein